MFVLLGVVALAPWPHGSVDISWVALWCGLLALSVAIASLKDVRSAHIRLLVPTTIFMIVLTLVTWIQTIGDPPFGLAHPIWDKAEKFLGVDLAARISVVPHEGWLYLGGFYCFFLALVGGLFGSVSRTEALLVIRAVATIGAAYALYALVMLIYDSASMIWSDRAERLGILTNPFINRNHAATFYGSCAVIWLCMALSELERSLSLEGIGLVQAVRAHLEEAPLKLLIALGGLLLCLTAGFLTLSRAGVLLTLAVLFFCSALFSYRVFGRRRKFLLVAAIAVFAGAIFIEIWGGALAYRIGMEGLLDQDRWETYRSTMALISEHPLFGNGLGSFQSVFPTYRNDGVSTRLVWDYAHNTLMELAADLGLVIAFGAIATFVFIIVALARGIVLRRRDGHIPLAALGVALLAAAHSMVDGPLQIPAYAILCGAVLGCGLAQSIRSSVRSQ